VVARAVTVRGFVVPDELECTTFDDEVLRNYERSFRRIARHTDCQVCHGSCYAQPAFVFPRNGFSEFPLDFRPGVVQSRKAV
jgi:hypothetical protein